MSVYRVTVSGRAYLTLEVEADDEDAARAQAENDADDELADGAGIEWEVESIVNIGGFSEGSQ